MRIDVIDISCVHAGIAHRIGHAARRAITVLARRRHVVGVGTHAKTGEFGVDFRPTRLGMLIFFKNQHARTFRQHKAIAILIPRTAGSLRIVVTG